jgi:hypothetical protein
MDRTPSLVTRIAFVALVGATPAAAQQMRIAIDPQTLDMMKIEAAFGPVVRGAPYSGEGVTTTTQTLADGTHIERTVRARFYRDSDGRTRREQTILGMGALGESQAVSIVDPVAGVMYGLNPATREGRRSPMPVTARRSVSAGQPGPPPPPPPPPPGEFSTAATAPPPPLPPPPPGIGTGTGTSTGVGTRRAGTPAERVPNVPEPLGTKQIDGLTVVGTKRTEIIPVGRIGNDRPIEITDERWESTELKVLVLMRHHDPRSGDVEYRLMNVLRSEPPRDLFQAPADYAITDGPPPPPPPPRQE